MSPLQGLVDATSVALGGARELFGPAAQGSGWSSTAGLGQTSATLRTSVETVPQNWQGPGGEAYQVRGNGRTNAMDFVVDADGQTGPRIVQASNDSRDGRSGINMVMGDTRNGVTAIAPSTDTPAGKQQLVDHLDHQLDRAKLLLQKSEQRGALLARMISAGGQGYGPPGGAAPPGMGMGGAPAGLGGGAGGGLGGLSAIAPALSGLIGGHQGLHGPRGSGRRAGGVAPASSAARIPLSDVSYAGRGTFPSGSGAMAAAINAALDARGVTDPVARKRWFDGYMTLTGRESTHNAPRWVVNTEDTNAHGAQMSDGAPAGSSRGPAQCTPGTFASHHQPGTSTSIYEPVANIAASMNYVMDRWGVSPDASNLAANVAQADPGRRGGGY